MQGGATYQYGQKAEGCSSEAGPHAVTGVGNMRYCYDANGNQTHSYDNGALARQIDYAHYDKPTLISAGGSTTGFAYDTQRKRYKRTTTKNGLTTTTYYVGNVEVVSKSDSNITEIKRYLPGAIETRYQDDGSDTGNAQLRYLHKDHLGSIDSITDEQGKLVDKLYFDVWGKRTSIAYEDWGANAKAIAAESGWLGKGLLLTNRGFTGHEHVEHADIIHMNGRIYDPSLGRFLQADPHIQAPGNSQSYNRYSYVLNNPLSYTDPSGYFFSKLWKGIKKFASVIVGAALIYFTGGLATSWFAATWYGAATAGAIAGGVGAALNGGNILKGALTGAFSAAAFYGVGTAFGDVAAGSAAHIGKIAAHGVVGGAMSVLQGGKFGHGFAAAGITQAFAKGIDSISKGARFSLKRIAAAAIVGGTASKLSGGKFANGAVTGAFSRMFNDELHKGDDLYHEYEFTSEICERSMDSCTPGNVWESTKNNSVPLQDGPLHDGKISEIPGIGKVVTHVDDANYTLVNETLPGHKFEYGTVTRRMLVTDQTISIQTIGVGVNSGSLAWAMNYAAASYFPLILDSQISNDIYFSSSQFHKDMKGIH